MTTTTSPTEVSSATTQELLLKVAEDNYAAETARTTAIDTKAGISLPIISGYFVALISSISDWTSIINCHPVTTPTSVVIRWLAIIYGLETLAITLIALFLMIGAIGIRSYKRVSIQRFYDEHLLSENPNKTYVFLIGKYIAVTKHNTKSNNSRISLYYKSWVATIISLGLLIIYSVLTLLTSL